MPYRNGQLVDWKHKLKIKHTLTNDCSLEGVKKTSKAIARILGTAKNKKILADFLADWELEDIASFDDCEDFNAWMSDLYDFCDARLIWVE